MVGEVLPCVLLKPNSSLGAMPHPRGEICEGVTVWWGEGECAWWGRYCHVYC